MASIIGKVFSYSRRWPVWTPVVCWCALALPGALHGEAARTRVSFKQLNAETQTLASACQEAAKKSGASDREHAAPAAEDLFAQAKKLTAAAPDFFLGWVWLAQASLVLDDASAGRTAGANLIALGVAQNRNLQILQTMADLEKKGWLDVAASTTTTAVDSAASSDAVPASERAVTIPVPTPREMI